MNSCECIHEIENTNNGLTLTNVVDPHYVQTFKSPEELEVFICKLKAAGTIQWANNDKRIGFSCFEQYFKCAKHAVPYPKGARCPKCLTENNDE